VHPRKTPKYAVELSPVRLGEIFAHCSDYVSRELRCGGRAELTATLCYLDGIVSGAAVNEDVLRPLTDPIRFAGAENPLQCALLALEGGVTCAGVKRRETMDDVVSDLTAGHCALLFPGKGGALTFEVRSPLGRSVEQPNLEKAVRGPKDSFVELLRSNTTLVRKKIRLAELKFLQTTVGRKTNTAVAVAYIDGVADPALVEQVTARLEDIDIDGLLSPGSLEEYLIGDVRSPFPQIHFTERPDRFAMNLLEGRVGILVDGLPFGFLLPASFLHFLRVPEEKAQHFLVATTLRLLRYLALVMATLVPAVFVAVSMYHQEMIPTRLLQSMISDESRKSPLSDEQLSVKLKNRGIKVSRRTIAKYREQLHLPPAFQRHKDYKIREL